MRSAPPARSRLYLALVMLFAFFGGPGACTPPSDPVGFGTLCIPTSGACGDEATLERESVGRNAIDFEIYNRGPATEATVRVASLTTSGAFGEEPGLTLFSRTYALQADETARDQIGPTDIGTDKSLHLSIKCAQPGCDVVLDYVFVSQPLECIDDGECTRTWKCEQNTGRCVECTVPSDCSANQTCDLEEGRCTPPESSGCASVSSEAPFSGGLGQTSWLLVLLFGVLLKRKSSQRPARHHGIRVHFGLTLVLVAVITLTTRPAQAGPPQAGVAVGYGVRVLTGELGENTSTGYGLTLTQELRKKYFGGAVYLMTGTFDTTHSGPPFDQALQTYALALGPRVFIPIQSFELSAGVDYMRWGVASNSLVRQTGLGIAYNAFGVTAGARFHWSSLELRLEGGYHPIIGLPGSMITLDLMIGITNF